MRTKQMTALFFAGFFTKDVIDDIFFLIKNEYPMEIFGFYVTATTHKIMLAVSFSLTCLLLLYAISRRNRKAEVHG